MHKEHTEYFQTENDGSQWKTEGSLLEKSAKENPTAFEKEPFYRGDFAVIDGDVRFGADVSVWPHAVIRTESEPITIGDRSNIQDGCVLHTDAGYPIVIGQDVTVGHRAIIHGATIEDGALIGMGAILLNGSVIGRGAIVGAGALVGEGKKVEPGTLYLGIPARKVRQLSSQEIENGFFSAHHYVELAHVKKQAGRTAEPQKRSADKN